MRNRVFLLFGASVLAFAQFGQQQNLAHKIDFPHDAPVSLAGDEWGGSAATVRGGAYAIDVRVALSLRNASPRRIRGITLTVLAQEATPGGKGSISVPSLDVAPGETFSVRGDLHLLRPIGAGASPMVEVSLDGVLFDDLNFYGPDKLHSRRTMMVWELEARRDRQFFKALLDQSGRDGLQKEMLSSLAATATARNTASKWCAAAPPTAMASTTCSSHSCNSPTPRSSPWAASPTSPATKRARPS